MIRQYKGRYRVRLMCRVLNLSESSYYDWLNRTPSKRAQENEQLTLLIKERFDAERSRASAKRITLGLRRDGIYIEKNRVARIMRKMAGVRRLSIS